MLKRNGIDTSLPRWSYDLSRLELSVHDYNLGSTGSLSSASTPKKHPLEQNAPLMVRMFGVDARLCQDTRVGKAAELGIGIMDVIFRAAGETRQQDGVHVLAVDDRWDVIGVENRFRRHVISPVWLLWCERVGAACSWPP